MRSKIGNRFTYKGKSYYIIDDGVKMKHPTTREWVDAIVYSLESINNFQIYIREAKEFFEKFKPKNDDDT